MQANATSFKLRFAAYAETDDAAIEFALEEARLLMGQWTKPGRDLAMMYLAAHILAVSEVAQDSQGRVVIHESIGRLSTTYGAGGAERVVTETGSTAYGRRYLAIQRKNSKMVKMVGEDFPPTSVSGRY